MPRITWDDSYSVSNDEIDAQHQKWIGIINELHEALVGDVNIGKDMTIQSLKAMDDYTRFHFAHEEEFLRSVNYPDFDAHKQIHETFLKMVKKYMNDIEHDHVVLNTEIMKMLMNWLKLHILEEDMKYSSYGEH